MITIYLMQCNNVVIVHLKIFALYSLVVVHCSA